MSLKLMSYNIRISSVDETKITDELQSWKYRKEEVINCIKNVNPDILFLQEDTNEQIEFISKNLKENYTYYTGFNRKNIIPENMSILIKKGLGIEVLNEKVVYISDNKETKIFENMPFEIIVRNLEIKKKNKIFNIASTHLLSIGILENIKIALEYKEREAKKFIEIIQREIDTENNFIICGDFNFRTECEAHKVIKSKLIDVSEVFNVREPTVCHWLKHHQYAQIDYFFVSKNLRNKLKSFEIIKYKYKRSDDLMMEPSDHLPIVMEISL